MANHTNATNLINLYCGSLRNVIAQHNANYTYESTPEGFSCELTLPFNSPVRGGGSNGFFRSKQLAKQSAALAAVEQLILAGEFNAELVPTPANPAKRKGEARADNNGAAKQPTIEDQRNAARAELDSKKEVGTVGTETYQSLLWSNLWKPIPADAEKLHGLTLTLVVEGVDSPPECRTLCVLTANELPTISVDVSVHNTRARVEIARTRSFRLTAEQREQTFAFTRRLLQAMSNMRVESEEGTTPILLLPLLSSWRPKHRARESDVDWAEVTREQEQLSTDPKELRKQLQDAVVAFGDFNRKYTATVQGDSDELNLKLTQFVSARKGGVVASITKSLDTNERPASELHKISVSASVLRIATILPQVIAQLDDRLVAAQANALLGGKLDPALVLEALCPPGARKAEETSAGHENYERLEFFGDTVLKLFATLDVFDLVRTEGAMTRFRHHVVSNRALKLAAVEAGIVPYIRSNRRKVRDVVPPGWVTVPLGDSEPVIKKNEPADNFTPQSIGDKTIADVAEALLGAAYQSAEGGDVEKLQAALDIAHTLKIPLKMKRFPVGNHAESATTLETYRFKDKGIEDVTMSLRKNPTSNGWFEAFEFLGDAIVDYVTMIYLWNAYPTADPAQLTIMKHSRVSNAALGSYTATIGLHKRLSGGDKTQEERMRVFEGQVATALKKADERREKGEKVDEFWSRVPEYKFMGDILEALVGAIYHDSGDISLLVRLLEPARAWIDKYALNPASKNAKPHPKSALLETLAKMGCHEWTIEKVAPGELPSEARSSAAKRTGAEGMDEAKTLGGAGALRPSPPPAKKARRDLSPHLSSLRQRAMASSATRRPKDQEGAKGIAKQDAGSYGALVTWHGAPLGSATGRTPQLAQRSACEMALERLGTRTCGCKTSASPLASASASVDPSPKQYSGLKRAHDAGPDSADAAERIEKKRRAT